ncbi:MAG: hypothetical protein WAU36_12040 [Cyclobacteriaceae bacterium]
MQKHLIDQDINEGKKVRRAGWPKGDHMQKVEPFDVELSDDEREDLGLSPEGKAKSGACLVYVEGKEKATYGYELSHSDKVAEDWELAK